MKRIYERSMRNSKVPTRRYTYGQWKVHNFHLLS